MTTVEERTYDADEVPFVPRRMCGHPRVPRGDLSVATASCLIDWVADCPACGADLEGSAKRGLAEDRDVVFEARTVDQDPFGQTRPLRCEACGALVEAFVEEAAQPRRVSERKPEYVQYGAHWIRFEEGDLFMQVVPDVRVWEASGAGVDRYRDEVEA
jgi:hypothetical protein